MLFWESLLSGLHQYNTCPARTIKLVEQFDATIEEPKFRIEKIFWHAIHKKIEMQESKQQIFMNVWFNINIQ